MTQWQPSEVLIGDNNDSHLDQPIVYGVDRSDKPDQSALVTFNHDGKPSIVEPITPIFPPSHYLNIAGDLIEKGWITHAEARNAQGIGVEPEDESAVEWCTIGAMKAGIKYAPNEFRQYILRYLQGLFNAANAGLMLKHSWVWNNNDALDARSAEDHALVVKMFRRARDFALSHPEADQWPNAPFKVTKLHDIERLNK